MSNQPPVVSIKDLDTLIKEVARKKDISFTISGKPFSLTIRPLSNLEMSEAEKFTTFFPPRRKEEVLIQGKKELRETGEYDFQDATYKKEMAEAMRKKTAVIIDTGLVDLKIPGASLDEKSQYIEKNFTPDIIDLLVKAIVDLSSDDIKVINLANFISGGDSQKS